jgi:hypothetical protein
MRRSTRRTTSLRVSGTNTGSSTTWLLRLVTSILGLKLYIVCYPRNVWGLVVRAV